MENKIYFCIDLKSFYASVECAERKLDPMTTNLVVADPERSDKTICLAVSPSLKKLGVKNRCRVFEIPSDIDYIMAEPRMKKYIQYSADIYGLYLEYFNKEDIHVYSIDEVFIDVTPYLKLYNKTPIEMAQFLLNEIKKKFKIYATCGIGTNLFLAKVALDITAKNSDDFIGILDQKKFKKELGNHQPLTDFWRIGKGIQNKLQEIGIFTLKDLRNTDPEILYQIFGIDAELLIDHANGIEPVTIQDIKQFKPKNISLSNGQVLMRDYSVEELEIIIREMTFDLFLKLVSDNLVTSNVSVSIRYAKNENKKHENFSVSFNEKTNNYREAIDKIIKKYYELIDHSNKVRKVTISLNNLTKPGKKQLSFFSQPEYSTKKDLKLDKTVVDIKKRFGKNAVIKGLDLLDNATSIQRHDQIGGHKSG